jgi:6-phosphogluconolactonase
MIIFKDILDRLKKPTVFVLCLAILLCPLRAAEPQKSGSTNTLVYIGTYTGAKSKGIYVCHLDGTTGAVSTPVLAAETPGPSFLDTDARGHFLYAVNSVNTFEGRPAGAITAFSIDQTDGRLTQLNQRSTIGTGPCHVALDRSGKNALVANYGNGSESVLPIQPDGTLGDPSSYIQFEGHGANPDRQEKPHAHGTTFDASNHFAFVCDLGTDRIMSYRLDAEEGKLTPNEPPWFSVHAGAGPRHMAIHPTRPFAYVINEMQSSITGMRMDASRGSFREIQMVSLVPDGFTNQNTGSEIAIHPSGKFLYGSNRGHDSIAVFQIDPGHGTLSPVQHQPTHGKTPRNFGIDPTGNFLIAANQDSDNLVVFRINQETGKLAPTGQELTVGSPVCVKFVKLEGN